MKNKDAPEALLNNTEVASEQPLKPRIETNAESEPLLYSLPSLSYRQSEQVGKHGFSNGLLRIPKESYEYYIAAYEENKRLGIFINKLEQEAQLRQEKIKTTAANRDQLLAEIICSKQESAYQREEKEKFQQSLQEIKARVKSVREQFLNRPPAYGWIGTILFITAGVIFIKTDISIIEAIAGRALDMPKAEAATFALGVAFLAIVIKPLVDRVFEKPYQNGKKAWMHVLLIMIGISTVTALGFMGAYRNQAYIAAKNESEIRRQLNVLNDEVARGMRSLPDPTMTQLEVELQAVINAYSSDLVWWIFVLSSILFALAGAICFSIGVPAFREHANRVTERSALWVKRWWDLKKFAKADKGWRQAENRWRIAEQQIPFLLDLNMLEGELKRLLQEIQIARAAQHQSHTDAVLAIYQDNYHRGERFIPSEEELARYGMLLNEKNGQQQNNYQLNRKFSGSNLFNSQYLHEYIRQRIHKDNNQQPTQNGKIYNKNGVR